MSLKDFHLVFITSAIVLLGGFGYWGTQWASETLRAQYFNMGVGAYVLALVLVVYEIIFSKKIY